MAAVRALISSLRARVFANDAHSHEAGLFEERIDPAHRRQRFDPRHGASIASPANECRGDAGPAIGRVQHHARQEPKLPVERTQMFGRARIGEPEEARAHGQRCGRRAEDHDADRLAGMPEQDDPPDEGEVVTAIMPPSEIRPIGSGAFRQPKLVREANAFFLTSRRSAST